MAGIDSLLNQIPVQQIARQLGVDEAEAQQAIQSLIPALVGGMNANAQDPQGAASLTRALNDHDGGLFDNPDVGSIDTGDGDKIVHNIFGGQTGEVVNRLGGGTAGGSGLVQKLLPMLAPIVMAWLAKEMSQRVNAPKTQAQEQPRVEAPRGDAGGLTPVPDVQRGDSTPASPGSDMLTDILGQVLGGGRQQQQQQKSSGNVIMDMLGGLLGGGRR